MLGIEAKPSKEEIRLFITKQEYHVLYNKNLIEAKKVKMSRLRLDIETLGLDIEQHEKQIERLEKLLIDQETDERFENIEVKEEHIA